MSQFMTVMYDIILTPNLFFFLNQQFITWGVMADHGNYLVAIVH